MEKLIKNILNFQSLLLSCSVLTIQIFYRDFLKLIKLIIFKTLLFISDFLFTVHILI